MTLRDVIVKPTKLFVPAIFLLVLGLGNIGVGSLKKQQYQQVLSELTLRSPELPLINASPLRRIQLNRHSEDRNLDRLKQAQTRIDLYHLVILGGAAMVSLGSVLLLLSACVNFKYAGSKDK